MTREAAVHMICDRCQDAHFLTKEDAGKMWHEITATTVTAIGSVAVDLCPACIEDCEVWWRAALQNGA